MSAPERVVIGNAELWLGDKRKRVGPAHPLYRGGKRIDAQGYVTITSGPGAGMREHRVIMSAALGRVLLPTEIVHHVNGNKADNRLANLSLETRASHNREHGKGSEVLCRDCGKRKWYSPSNLARRAPAYRCRGCWIKGGGNAACMNP